MFRSRLDYCFARVGVILILGLCHIDGRGVVWFGFALLLEFVGAYCIRPALDFEF